MKKIAIYTFFALFLVLSVHAHAEFPTVDAATTPSATTSNPMVDPSTLPLAARQEKAYTELSSISVRLTDITNRLEKALTQLAENNIDVSTVTPLLEKARLSLGTADTSLVALAPLPQTVAVADTAPTTFSTKMATPVTPTPEVVTPTEAEVKTAVTAVETNLKEAKQNLIVTLTTLKAILAKTNTAQ